MNTQAATRQRRFREDVTPGFRMPIALQLILAGLSLLAIILLMPIGVVALAWYNGD